jgi:hypothetical protein
VNCIGFALAERQNRPQMQMIQAVHMLPRIANVQSSGLLQQSSGFVCRSPLACLVICNTQQHVRLNHLQIKFF